MNKIPKITLDTNCIINLFDFSNETLMSTEELLEIMNYGLSGKIEISITTRVESDLLENKDQQKKERMLQTLKMFQVVGSVFRLDESFLGGKDVLVEKKEETISKELQKIVFPGLTKKSGSYVNNIRDIDHLTGHILNNGDIFVTDDKKILKKQETLKNSYGLIVMNPFDCLCYLKSTIQENKKLTTINVGDKYKSPSLSGKVTFNYSNNNGSFIIGNGYFLFETKWSKASDVSIHVYNDASSIDSIALANTTTELKDVKDFSIFDYSSRCRTVKKGGVVVLKNINNIYAIIKVIDIKDDSRRDDVDELIFEYIIKLENN